MVKSMTAFGRGKVEGTEKDVTVEIKSVNSRYFDCSIKMPRQLSFLEERVKSYVQKNAISRGKVDVYITVENRASASLAVEIDEAYAESYIAALRALGDRFGLKDDISIMTVARNPEVFVNRRAECDLEEEWVQLKAALDLALDDHTAMRTQEGERTISDLKDKVESLRIYSVEIEEISKEDTVGYRDKLETRIRAMLDDNGIVVDENRLLTECALFADKIAIDEELVRLRSHFDAFYEISGAKEPAGRKLDFLMQEMNRETNTIGSKANNIRIARIVVEMKGVLEKIREQVQNIE